MEDDSSQNVSGDEKLQETREYDPRLDFFSEQFDPLLALRTPSIIIPVASAKTFDNIHAYESAKSEVRKKDQEKKAAAAAAAQKEAPAAPFERRFLPHQMPITRERTFFEKNVFTRMEKVQGPLALLRTCIKERIRVKIWTRHSHDIRGYCLAFVTAFDKHWNLVLEDVEEVWTRRKQRKVPALDGAPTDSRIRPKVLPPAVTVVKSMKKTETVSRKMAQTMMRGEHVAYIVLMPEGDL